MSREIFTDFSDEGKATKIPKIVPSRVDYRYFNYCSTCEIKYAKQVVRCKECRQKVRTKPWHRSKIVQFKRL
ncbi:MAG TPA: hypothetical protein VJ599_00230 [Nitrososphaeraceae archaeon]|nr:hypothetical protein [Nitrososphaeraceae archaeon]